MARIRGRDTKPELLLRRALWARGLRGYRLHARLFGRNPDIVWSRLRLAVFVDGAFWHGHPSVYRSGRSGEYWDNKIARNIERDRETTTTLEEAGWAVVRIWDFEVLADPAECAERIGRIVAERRVAPSVESANVVRMNP
jgi:DNA mismatch endonuclease (patch repair protein)